MSTAGITTDFKRLLEQLLKNNIDSDGSAYYIGISRANTFDNISNLKSETLADQRTIRTQLQSVKSLTRSSFVVPTVEWQADDVYTAFDDNDVSLSNFYVVNSKREVFVCVQQSKDSLGISLKSTVEPTSTLAGNSPKSFATTDGYIWKLIHKINNRDYSAYKNLSYTPVSRVDLVNPVLAEDILSMSLQDSSQPGEIIGIAIDYAGSNYTEIPGIVIEGNGTNASFSAVLDSDRIVNITVDSGGSGNILHGFGYDYAKVYPSYGNAKLRPIIGPRRGMSYDPTETLKANSFLMKVDLDNNENGTILNENDFRCVVLMKDIAAYGSTEIYTQTTGNALNYFTLSNVQVGSTFLEDEILSTTSGTASAKIFHYDDTNNYLYYYQNDSTGYGIFTLNQGIETISGGQATIDAINNPDIDKYSGEILYINNVLEVSRDADQSEDIRLVIELD
jgi:hypothetical protein